MAIKADLLGKNLMCSMSSNFTSAYTGLIVGRAEHHIWLCAGAGARRSITKGAQSIGFYIHASFLGGDVKPLSIAEI